MWYVVLSVGLVGHFTMLFIKHLTDTTKDNKQLGFIGIVFYVVTFWRDWEVFKWKPQKYYKKVKYGGYQLVRIFSSILNFIIPSVDVARDEIHCGTLGWMPTSDGNKIIYPSKTTIIPFENKKSSYSNGCP